MALSKITIIDYAGMPARSSSAATALPKLLTARQATVTLCSLGYGPAK